MYGEPTNPETYDPEKEKDFYPVKTITVHTTYNIVNHGRWICGIELSFWDTEKQDKYSDQGVAENEKNLGCGEIYGGITASYDFERGEQLDTMSAFGNGFGTEPKHFYQTYYEWNAISKLAFKTSNGGEFDSTKGAEKYTHNGDTKGYEHKFDVEQRFLMGMTGLNRKAVITYHDGEHSYNRKSTPLTALGPIISEKVIGREIANFRNRRMDQTPSDGASVVNRTLCNDDWNVNAKP